MWSICEDNGVFLMATYSGDDECNVADNSGYGLEHIHMKNALCKCNSSSLYHYDDDSGGDSDEYNIHYSY